MALHAMMAAFKAQREALVGQVSAIYHAGESLPVLQYGELIFVVHPSTRCPGKIQVTTFNGTGALGDSQIERIEDLCSAIGTSQAQLLGPEDALEALEVLGRAEGHYQTSRA